MKLTVFVLIAGLCLVAVTANASGNFNSDNDEIEKYEYLIEDSADDIIDIETYGFISVLKNVLRTIKGLNCALKEVFKIQTAAQNFIDEIKACGGQVTKQVQQLINACNGIINTCKSIFGINGSVCGNTVDEDNVDNAAQTFGVVSGVQNTRKCCFQMLSKFIKLYNQTNNVLKMIKKVPKVPGAVGSCANNACNNLASYFTQFCPNVIECSKLTS